MKNRHHPAVLLSKRTRVEKPRIYRVVIERDGRRYHAEVPALPGCYSWGRTYEDALKNVKEAVAPWLETLAEDGEPIPEENLDTLRKAPVTLGVIV